MRILFPVTIIDLAVLAAALALTWVCLKRVGPIREKTPGPWCRFCGYSLHGHPEPPADCPECGRSFTTGKDIFTNASISRRNATAKQYVWVIAAALLFILSCRFLVPAYINHLSDQHFNRPWDYLNDVPEEEWNQHYKEIVVLLVGHAWLLPWDDTRGPWPEFFRTDEPMQMFIGSDDWGTGVMTIDRVTLAFSYEDQDGNMVRSSESLDEKAIVSWIGARGFKNDSDRVKQEATLLLPYLNAWADRGDWPPENADSMSHYGHVPQGSYYPRRPVWGTVIMALLWVFLWNRGRKRIASFETVETPNR